MNIGLLMAVVNSLSVSTGHVAEFHWGYDYDIWEKPKFKKVKKKGPPPRKKGEKKLRYKR